MVDDGLYRDIHSFCPFSICICDAYYGRIFTLALGARLVVALLAIFLCRHTPCFTFNETKARGETTSCACDGVYICSLGIKIPSVTGSSSHPTGTGFGALLFGPFIMTVIGTAVLLFQALLLAHGGLTTLGANAFSMAVVGPLVAYGLFVLCKKCGISLRISVFLAAMMTDLATYVMTSFQLALAFPDVTSGVWGAFLKFASILR